MAVLDAQVRNKALAATMILDRLSPVRAAYVFGSQVDGRAGEWSDIDVAAFMEGIENWNIQRRARAMGKVMIEAGSDVEAHLFSASSLDRPEPGSFAAYILQNGVRVFPEDKAVRLKSNRQKSDVQGQRSPIRRRKSKVQVP